MTVRWRDKAGSWVRQAFASRPDNIVVQRIAPATGQPISVRLSLHRSAAWTMSSGADWGSHAGIGAASPDRMAFNLGASGAPPVIAPARGVDACEVHQSAHEGRLVYTCRLDPDGGQLRLCRCRSCRA